MRSADESQNRTKMDIQCFLYSVGGFSRLDELIMIYTYVCIKKLEDVCMYKNVLQVIVL